MDKLTSRQLQQKLNELGFEQYSAAFLQNEISGADIPYITEDHLIEMGVELIGHRMLLIKRLNELYEGKNPDPVHLIDGSNNAKSKPEPKISRAEVNYSYNRRTYEDNSDSDDFKQTKPQPVVNQKTTRTPKYNYHQSESDEYESRSHKRENTYNIENQDVPRPILKSSNASSSSRQDAYDSDQTRPSKRETPKISRTTIQTSSNTEEKTEKKLSKKDSEGTKLSEASSTIRNSTSKLQSKPSQSKPEPKLQPAASESQFNTQNLNTQDSSDRVVCQYCGRKFLPDAARRHIPVCGRIRGMSKK